MSELPGLIVPIEARINKLEQGLQKANHAQRRASGEMERRAKQSAHRIERTYSRMGNGIAATFKRAFLPLLATAGFAQITRKAHKLAEDYRQVENRLRAIGETSDEAAEKLAAAAIRSGSNIGDMGQTVMRVQKATNDGYDETIRRVETLNKLLTTGGASTAEANSVSLQLSQALSSGVLQGDELRSLREAAPVELLDAIAKAAGGTRDQLKDMGAQGKLTSDVVLRALDDMAASADVNFKDMAMTSDRAMTNLNTGLVTFVGRLDEGLGASERLAIGINDLGAFLNDNAAAAEEFGRSLVAAFDTLMTIEADARAALEEIADLIQNEMIGSTLDFGSAFADTGLTVGQVLNKTIDGLTTFVGAIEGSAMAAREAFKKIPDAISAAMQGAINSVITGVEAMINRVLDGVRVVAQAVDDLTAKVPGYDGTSLAGGIEPFKMDRVTGLASNHSTQSVADAYREGAERGKAGAEKFIGGIEGYFDEIQDRFKETRDRLEREAAEREARKTPTKPGETDDDSGGGSGGRPSRGGGGRAALDGFTKAAQSIREKTDALRAEAEALSQVTSAQIQHGDALDYARTRAELLQAAQRSGVEMTPELVAQIDQMAEAYTRAGADADMAADRIAEIQNAGKAGADAVTGIFDQMANGALSAEDAVKKLLIQIAKMIVQKQIAASVGGGIGGPGGDWLGKIAGALMGGFAAGGYTGDGPKMQPAGIVHAGEFVLSKEATSRIGVANLEALHKSALQGYSGGGLVAPSKALNARSGSRTEIQGAGQPISVTNNVSVEGSAGTPEQNADLSKCMAKELEASMRGTVVDELRKQMRPGNLLNQGGR